MKSYENTNDVGLTHSFK